MVNNCVICGRLTKDIEMKSLPSGTLVGNFCLAVDRPKSKDGEKKTDFIDCSMWNADKLAQYLVKGKPIAVIGSIQVRNWEDKEGNKRKSTEVKVDRVNFLPDGKGNSGNQQQKRPSVAELVEEAFETPFTEDDLPF